ncbi:hypothetical protein L1785_06995 [Antribacter sp. KLBMP9083]|uniref:Uncharacterized protein n=1 Tax=Antribacter soli TaxID=2910976 RepID=A0AA41U6W7_9MICO|nr:hypothetical protein [Antribacter soli]MCF4120720.1 hypothetical protein [Antribacter soli]
MKRALPQISVDHPHHVQSVWCAPHPGRLLAWAWFLSLGTLAALGYAPDPRPVRRFVLVLDPAASEPQANDVASRIEPLVQDAQRRYRWSLLTHALFLAAFLGTWTLTILLSIEFAAADPSTPFFVAGGFATCGVLLPLAYACDRRPWDAGQRIAAFEAPRLLRSHRIGGERRVLRLLAKAEGSPQPVGRLRRDLLRPG